ncbi:MAG: PAS domain S-box protein, partial [Deltaproteobacteria bacterium]
RHVAVVSDVTTTGLINYQRFLGMKPAFTGRLDFIELVGLTTAQLTRRLETLPRKTIILLLAWNRDLAGQTFTPAESMDLLHNNSSAPVYTCWGYLIEAGAMGGIVVSGERQGEEAARMTLRILKGEPATAIPVVATSPNQPMFNYQRLQRFGIVRSALPSGAVIVNEPNTFYYRYRHIVWEAVFLSALQFFIILGLVINFWRRRKAEARQRRSEARFRSYFELGLIGAAVGNADKKWVAVNDRLCQILGYSREELLGKTWTELTYQEDVPANLERFTKMAAGELDGFTMEKRFIRKDGQIIETEISVRGVKRPDGALDFTVVHIQDVTARKKAEKELDGYREHLEELVLKRTQALSEANERLHLEVIERQQAENSLRESEEKHRNLVERANDGIFILRDNHFKYVNPALAELLGYTQEEFLSLTCDRILAPDVREILHDRHQRRMAGEKVPCRFETRVVHKNGQIIEVEFNVGLITYEGEPASLAFVRDIRERKQLEEERAKVGRLESIGVLAGGIAHDFNNLLTGILGNVSFAKFLVDGGSKAARLLSNAEKISLRARELTQRLITFAEGGEPVKKILHLKEFLPQAVEFALSGSGIHSRFTIAEDLWQVEGDPDQLRQLISILVLNAREAMPGGGEIEVGAENIEVTKTNNLEEGRYVRLIFADFGKGIAPELLPRIFDPYFSTKEMGPHKGTGLGLAIAYSIVRRHGGLIEVDSQVDLGTTVTIHLPAARHQEFRSLADLAGNQPGQGKKILLLEDDPEVRDIAQDILQFMGYEAASAATGEQTIERYRQAQKNGRTFDAVILDLTIRGGMGGIATMEKLLQLDPGVRAVVASGFANEPVLTDYRHYGFKAAITKPYHLEELNGVLEKILAGPARSDSPDPTEGHGNIP